MLVDDSSAGHYILHVCTSCASGKTGHFPGAWQWVRKEGNTAGTATAAGVKVSINPHVLKPLGAFCPLGNTTSSMNKKGFKKKEKNN